MSELASAFVRVRPNTAGFRSELDRGVTSSFSSVFAKAAKVAGVAFGAKFAFDLGKNIVNQAADIQKQIEGVRSEFGAAGKSILDFSNKGATALGISAQQADTTANRFGILFKNLGIAPQLAATMTVNFEKLAGSISQIRNVDPATVMQNLPLAIAGNLRSLKQLGIAVDQNTLKAAAFKLGLTQTINQALTPSQKAIAIYAVATAKLSQLQAQAQGHAGDLANKERKLRAEWTNAKDELGRGLLPMVGKLVSSFSTHLPGAIASTKAGFSKFKDVLKGLTGPIGGLGSAMKTLIATFAVAKVIAFATAIKTAVVGTLAGSLATTLAATKAEVIATFTTGEIMAEAWGATIKGVLISTGIGALVVALGFVAQYVFTHWGQVKRWFEDFAHMLPRIFHTALTALVEVFKAAIYGILEYWTLGLRALLTAASHLPFIGKYAKRALNAINDEINKFKPDFSKVSKAWQNKGTADGKRYADAFITSAKAEINTFGGTLPALSGLLGKQVNDAVTAGVLNRPATNLFDNERQRLLDAQKGLLDTYTTQLANQTKAGDAAVKKIHDQLGTLGQNLRDALTQENQDLQNAIDSARQNLSGLGDSLAQQIGDVLDKPIADAQDKINQLQHLRDMANLRASVILPGGKQLSADPHKALAQLEALAHKAGATNRRAIQDFIAQYQQASLAVKQDQIDVTKKGASRRISDLTDAFNRGKITYAQFRTHILGELRRDGVNYKKAGQLLGSAFANGFRDSVQGLLGQAQALVAATKGGGRPFSTVSIVKPLDAILSDQKQVATIQREIRDKHGALQTKIASNTAKAATILAQMQAARLGPTSIPIEKALRGNGAKKTKTHAGTTG